jgi:hypothetical protein
MLGVLATTSMVWMNQPVVPAAAQPVSAAEAETIAQEAYVFL